MTVDHIAAFESAVRRGDAAGAAALLERPDVRAQVNAPLFDFGQRAAHVAARNIPLLEVLLAAGSDLNLKSEWANGPYTVLDNADETTARFLLSRGARLTPNVAARLGWFDELKRMVSADASTVHARGGDGQQPLHEAKTTEIADYLLDRRAGIDVRCIDHHSTPAQYALVGREEVCRRLLARGATADIFMAARLGDIVLASTLLDNEPACAEARINAPGYAPVPPMHIYCWTLGFGLSPHEVAEKSGHQDVYELLMARSPVRLQFVNAASMANEAEARRLLEQHPALISLLGPNDHAELALAIFHERFPAAALMLSLGFDPEAPGIDGGSALHAACWVGNLDLVQRILESKRVPVDARDPTHGSTPIGWAAFGAVHRRAPGADYPAVARRLAAAGADLTLPGNRSGKSLIEMAVGNAEMQDALRHLGA